MQMLQSDWLSYEKVSVIDVQWLELSSVKWGLSVPYFFFEVLAEN